MNTVLSKQMLNKLELNKLNSLILSDVKNNRAIFEKLSDKTLKHLVNTAYNINHGNVALNEEELSKMYRYKQCMLCLGNSDVSFSLGERKVFLNKQKGQGFFTVLLPILASIAIAALTHE